MWDKLTRKEKIEDIMNNIKQNKQANSTEITEEIMLEIEEIKEKEKASIVKTKKQVQKQEEAKLRDEGVVGGGSPSGSVLIPNTKPRYEYNQEGGPPIGKEQGSLGWVRALPPSHKTYHPLKKDTTSPLYRRK